MSTNIEIKARAHAPARQRDLAAALSDVPGQPIDQTDTYFNVPRGRLKLRETAASAELIYYERPDKTEPKRSDYLLVPAPDPAALRSLLTAAFGIRGVVRKTRLLFRVGRTRIHIDDVSGLGTFIELEVVLSLGESPQQGQAIAAELMRRLQIRPQELLCASYIDLSAPDTTPRA